MSGLRLRSVALFLAFSMSVSDLRAATSDFGYGFEFPSMELSKQLARLVNFDGFDDPKLTFQGAVDSLSKTYKIPLTVHNWEFEIKNVLAQPIARTPIPAMHDVPLGDVIRAVIARIPGSPGTI